MKWIALTPLLYSSLCLADLTPLNEHQLQRVDGQAGITLSGRMEFEQGTRFSYQNEDAEYIDNTAYWLVMNEVTGGIGFSDMKLDLIDGIGPNGDKTALQITLPEELEFEQLQTEGFYLGDNREVNQMSDPRFLFAVELDGKLQAPAQTKVNIFPVN
ncbi:hypothetical protein GCM10011297_30010 [Bacterioplanes sanyensis]|uniref:DUF6160 family protein n=1 Tax=Bacterioplanes sanyensis TaxID=1249553 RepID=UPI0016757466|nr:DUF6160 family protein [Bacterioplanes sanyensis]GGY55116.1 hypothetical protein GCM10011297_30010 [Bacterioplanes sanyensis]